MAVIQAEILNEKHPALRRRGYCVLTPDLETLAWKLNMWLQGGLSGALITGVTRVGKSAAMEYLCRNFSECTGLNAFTFDADWKSPDQGGVRERTFWRRLLRSLDYALTESGTGDDLEARLVERLAASASALNAHYVVLFIDNSNNLSLSELKWLCHLYDELERLHRLELIVLLFGQPELDQLRTLARQSNDTQIIGRFMRADYAFQGIQNSAQLRSVFERIDTELEFPPNSGVTFPMAFAPKAVKAGFRLTQLAERVWEAYLSRRRETLADSIQVGMTMMVFNAFLRMVLKEMQPIDSKNLQIEDKTIEAIMEVIVTQHA